MKRLLTLTITAAMAAGCNSMTTSTPAASSSMSSMPMASATLSPTTGNTANGMVHFMELSNGAVQVEVNLSNVPPGVHGFHVHDKGECGADGMAAGGHFNPATTNHGAPTATPHHAGDFGNVTADAAGNVKVTFATRSISVSAGANSVVGHAVILHANPDDLVTQPTGNAGGRIACGVTTMMSGDMHH